MKENRVGLEAIGWGSWFEEKSECASSEKLARVAAVDRDQLLLMDRSGTFRAKIAGSYLYRHHLQHEQPCVGDWVCVDMNLESDFGLIQSIVERRTSLRRKSAGEVIDYQMIAANVDFIIIVQSCHFDFNLKRLERYLVMVRDGGAEPYILLTKTDLVQSDVLESQLSIIRSASIMAPVFTLSNVTQEGIDEFRQLLEPGKTYCFVGSSGVGKSTLINSLIGREHLETKAVSGTGEGRHTTVRRELIVLEGGALVIDNPGMREFGMMGADEGIEASFSDIARLAENCRYRDCKHTSEPRCAVVAALKSGEISQEHYDNYIKLRGESEYYSMSYAQKRKKERDFGKYIKSAKKDLKDK